MGAKAKFLPMYGVNEATLLAHLVLVLPGFHEDLMVIEWCKYVSDNNIFKTSGLLVDVLQTMRDETEGQRCAQEFQDLQLLQQVNDEHTLLPSGTPNRTSAPDEDTDGSFDFGTIKTHR
jgi:hypothetical protein